MSVFIFTALSTNSLSQTQKTVSVGGDWNITFSQRGTSALLSIKQEGDKISASIKYSSGGERTGTGFVKDNEIEWTEIIKNVGTKVTIVTENKKEQKDVKKEAFQEYVYKGKIEEDVITGCLYLKGNEARQFEWKAVKKK